LTVARPGINMMGGGVAAAPADVPWSLIRDLALLRA
jgi:hypothetical protein